MGIYDEQLIEQHIDEITKKYLENKHTGGKNGQKGVRYEDLFCVYQLARLSHKVIDNNEEIYFYSQVKYAFVDDLIITFRLNSIEYARHHYQLKDYESSTISWNHEGKKLEMDFTKQYDLNSKIGVKNTELTLVVSQEALKESLEKNIPIPIQVYTKVSHFFGYKNIYSLIKSDSIFRGFILDLSAFDDDELYVDDKLESVALALYTVWCNKDESCNSAIEILKNAKKQKPNFIRCFPLELDKEKEIEAEVMSILSKIEDFNCYFKKGFLHWNYFYESGVLLCSVETKYFKKFKDKITMIQPKKFEDIDNLLFLYTGNN